MIFCNVIFSTIHTSILIPSSDQSVNVNHLQPRWSRRKLDCRVVFALGCTYFGVNSDFRTPFKMQYREIQLARGVFGPATL